MRTGYISATTFTVTGLTENTNYTFVVLAGNRATLTFDTSGPSVSIATLFNGTRTLAPRPAGRWRLADVGLCPWPHPQLRSCPAPCR